MPTNVADVANTGAASLPLLLAHAARDGSDKLRRGARVVLAGFGAGLSWGALALVWECGPPAGSAEIDAAPAVAPATNAAEAPAAAAAIAAPQVTARAAVEAALREVLPEALELAPGADLSALGALSLIHI